MSQYYVSGTAIGVKSDEYVILATDKQYVVGGTALSSEVKKLHKVWDRAYIAASGLISDMQGLVRDIRYLVGVRRLQLGHDVDIRSIAKITSLLLYNNKLAPFYTQMLVGGYDSRPELFSLDSLGSIMSDKYVTVGSGAETSIGVLESGYNESLSGEELKKLVVKAFEAVAKRDVTTGYKIDLVVISRDKVEEETISLIKV